MRPSPAGIIGLTLLASVVGQGKQTDATSEVTVCLHNTVVSTPGVVERAKMVARKMFASIGVDLHWRESCLEPPVGLTINVALISEESGDEGSEALGEAYPYAGSAGHIPGYIKVRYDRVRNSAGVSKDLEPVLLAHVLVHEITHILQCLDRHSDSGIMKAHWTSDDYYDMRWKPLTFTPEDVELIRLGMQVLRTRVENQSEPVQLVHGQ